MSLYTDPRFQAFMGHAWRPGGENLTRHGVSLCAWPSGAQVADVGCGPGGTVRLLRGMGYRVLGVDRHVDDEIRTNIAEFGAGIVVADACALPLPDASLDGVVCECVLSLLPEPERAVREISRVLRLQGRALISDVTTSQATSCLFGETAKLSKASCTDGALVPERMAAWIAEAGLRLVQEEDHRAVMRELAAQLAWRGMACGAGCGTKFGYHLWVVEKNGATNHA